MGICISLAASRLLAPSLFVGKGRNFQLFALSQSLIVGAPLLCSHSLVCLSNGHPPLSRLRDALLKERAAHCEAFLARIVRQVRAVPSWHWLVAWRKGCSAAVAC